MMVGGLWRLMDERDGSEQRQSEQHDRPGCGVISLDDGRGKKVVSIAGLIIRALSGFLSGFPLSGIPAPAHLESGNTGRQPQHPGRKSAHHVAEVMDAEV